MPPSDTDMQVLRRSPAVPAVCHFVWLFQDALGMKTIKPAQLEEALMQNGPLLWELLSKLLIDSRAERVRLRHGEGLSPSACVFMLRRRLDGFCAPFLQEDSDNSDQSDQESEDSESSVEEVAENSNKRPLRSTASNASKQRKTNHQSESDSESETSEQEAIVDAEAEWSLPSAAHSSAAAYATHAHELCDGWSYAQVEHIFDPADYFDCAPQHPLSDASALPLDDVAAWNALSMQDRLAILKALSDVRLMTQEFNDVLRLLDAAESTRVEPFAVDAENRAYFNFGFKDGRVYCEALQVKRSVFVQLRHSAARVMSDFPSERPALPSAATPVVAASASTEGGEEVSTEGPAPLNSFEPVPTAALAPAARRRASAAVRSYWFPDGSNAASVGTGIDSASNGSSFWLVSSNLAELRTLVQAQRALMEKVGKKGQQLTRELLEHLELLLTEAEEDAERERRAEELKLKKAAIAAMPRKRSERIQAIELERQRAEEEAEAERQVAVAKRLSYLETLSRHYIANY